MQGVIKHQMQALNIKEKLQNMDPCHQVVYLWYFIGFIIEITSCIRLYTFIGPNEYQYQNKGLNKSSTGGISTVCLLLYFII